MLPTHLTITQGQPFRFRVRVKRKDEEGELVPYELTGCKVQLQARPKINSTKTVLDLSSATSAITIDEEEGWFLVELTAAETSALIFGAPHTKVNAPFQCEVQPPDADDFRVLQGTLTLDPEVVR